MRQTILKNWDIKVGFSNNYAFKSPNSLELIMMANMVTFQKKQKSQYILRTIRASAVDYGLIF